MYIALIPEEPRFPKEHMTLVWMGRNPSDDDIEVAQGITTLVGRSLKIAPATCNFQRCGILGSQYVSFFNVPERIWFYRMLAVKHGLDMSEHNLWRPHVSAKRKSDLRREAFQLVRAELRE